MRIGEVLLRRLGARAGEPVQDVAAHDVLDARGNGVPRVPERVVEHDQGAGARADSRDHRRRVRPRPAAVKERVAAFEAIGIGEVDHEGQLRLEAAAAVVDAVLVDVEALPGAIAAEAHPFVQAREAPALGAAVAPLQLERLRQERAQPCEQPLRQRRIVEHQPVVVAVGGRIVGFGAGKAVRFALLDVRAALGR